MKVQMRFQKILALVSLIVAAVCFVSALIFMSGNLADIMYYRDDMVSKDFCASAQSFVGMMFALTIVYICAIAVFYFTDSNKRRNYYITNYVATGIAAGLALIVGAVGLIFTVVLMAQFYGMDWDSLTAIMEASAGVGGPQVTQSPIMFIISIFTSLLALVDAAAIAYNCIWKIKLMKGEKELLAGSHPQEPDQAPAAEEVQ